MGLFHSSPKIPFPFLQLPLDVIEFIISGLKLYEIKKLLLVSKTIKFIAEESFINRMKQAIFTNEGFYDGYDFYYLQKRSKVYTIKYQRFPTNISVSYINFYGNNDKLNCDWKNKDFRYYIYNNFRKYNKNNLIKIIFDQTQLKQMFVFSKCIYYDNKFIWEGDSNIIDVIANNEFTSLRILIDNGTLYTIDINTPKNIISIATNIRKIIHSSGIDLFCLYLTYNNELHLLSYYGENEVLFSDISDASIDNGILFYITTNNDLYQIETFYSSLSGRKLFPIQQIKGKYIKFVAPTLILSRGDNHILNTKKSK